MHIATPRNNNGKYRPLYKTSTDTKTLYLIKTLLRKSKHIRRIVATKPHIKPGHDYTSIQSPTTIQKDSKYANLQITAERQHYFPSISFLFHRVLGK